MIKNNYNPIHLNKILACNINIICNINNTNKTKQFHKINKIYLSECNKTIIKKAFIQKIKYSIQSIKKIHSNKILNIYIQDFINKMQIEGFINSKKSFNTSNNNKLYILLNFKLNPLVKKINIINYQNLLIPKNKLNELFKFQLGYPKNYNDINNSIYKINLWYKAKGFEWIKINLINNKYNDSIDIKIVEQKLISNTIICINKNKNIKKKLIYNILIKNELSVIQGKFVNKYYLDSIVTLLKKKYFIDYLEYIIQDKKNGVHVIFKYDITNNNTNLSYKILKQIKNKYNSIEVFIKQYHVDLFSYLKKPISTLIYIQKKISLLHLEYSFHKRLFYIYSQKYCLQYLVNVNFSYNKSSTFNLHIKYPNIKIYKQIELLFSNKYSYITNSIDGLSNYYILHLIKLNHFKIQQIIYILKKTNLEIQAKYQINKNITVKCQANSLSYQYMKTYISSYNYTKTLYKQLYKLLKIIKAYLIYYQIKIKYNISLYYLRILHLMVFKITYKLFFNLYKPISNNSLFMNSYKQYLNINIKHTFKVKPIKRYNHFLIILTEYNIYNNFITDFILLQKKILKINKNFNNNRLAFCLINSKYKIHVNNYNIFYIFMNYKMNLTYSNHYLISLNNLTIYPYNSKKRQSFIFGLGTQFNIPIKQMPYIRFEYIINSKQKAFVFIEK